MSNQALIIVCPTCQQRLVWPFGDWDVKVIGVIQMRHKPCGTLVEIPDGYVLHPSRTVQKKNEADYEDVVGRLLSDDLSARLWMGLHGKDNDDSVDSSS